MKPRNNQLVYIAGPFRGPNLMAVQENIEAARSRMLPIVQNGFMPVCVHTMEGLAMHDQQQEHDGVFWLEGTLEILRRCDHVIVDYRWLASRGTIAEVREAFRLKIPVWYTENVWSTPVRALGFERDGSGLMLDEDSPSLWGNS